MKRRSQSLKRGNRGSIVEFSAALIVFIFLFIWPLIDLIGLATGAVTLCLFAHECASSASKQRTYAQALATCTQQSNSLAASSLAKLTKVVPVSGSGVDLFVDASSFVSNRVIQYGPNTPVPPPIDQSNWVYEVTPRVTYSVGPIVTLSFLPALADVPGLGKPATLTFAASRASEYPLGLASEVNLANSAAAQQGVPTFDSGTANVDNSTWNNPNLYQEIAAQGQTIIDETVVPVHAHDGKWTLSGLTLNPGQKLWIDFKSTGLWKNGKGAQRVNANGYTYKEKQAIDPNVATGTLIGKVGESGAPFGVGVDFNHYAPSGTGPIQLMFNGRKGYSFKFSGTQSVRIVVTD